MGCDINEVKHEVLSYVTNEIEGAVSDGNCIMFNWGRYNVVLVPEISRQEGPTGPADIAEEPKIGSGGVDLGPALASMMDAFSVD